MSLQTKTIWVNGNFLEWEKAQSHILTHGLHYGTGAFDGLRFYNTEAGPAVFRLLDHMRRFVQSASYLKQISYSPEELSAVATELVKRNELTEGYIRPLFCIGCQDMGMNITNMPTVVSISCWPWGTYLGEDGLRKGVRCTISPIRRINRSALPQAGKLTGKYVNAIMAKMEAVSRGFEEAIMLNGQDMVAEGPGENIFIIKNSIVITPDKDSNILPGITRDSVITIAKDLGFYVEERPITVPELLNGDEAFFTGTAAEVTPIRQIDGIVIGNGSRGPITERLQQTFFSAIRGEDRKYRHWLSYV